MELKAIKSYEHQYPIAVPIFYQIMASLFFSLNSVTSKLLTRIPATQILMTRSVVTIIIINYFVQKYSINCYPRSRSVMGKLFSRGMLGSIGAMSWFQALKLMPLSESIVLMKTSPLWTALLAVFYLKKEKLCWKMMITVVMCIIGIVFISKPPFLTGQHLDIFYQFHTIGVILSLVCAITSTFNQILISSLADEVHQFTILQYFSVFTIVVPMLYQMYSPFQEMQVPNISESLLLMLSGVFGMMGQIFMNRSFILGNLTQISLVGQSQVLFNLLGDIFILHTSLDMYSYLGCTIIMTCLIQAIYLKKK